MNTQIKYSNKVRNLKTNNTSHYVVTTETHTIGTDKAGVPWEFTAQST